MPNIELELTAARSRDTCSTDCARQATQVQGFLRAQLLTLYAFPENSTARVGWLQAPVCPLPT